MFILLVVLVLLSTVFPVRAAENKPVSPQAQRMKDCNAHAHDRALAGDARKQFMSDCLKGGGSGPADRASQGATSSPSETGAPSQSSSPGKP
jgi:hypothetical protein